MYVDLKIKWKWGNEEGEVIETFGYSELTKEEINKNIKYNDWFWYEEGNGSCDCNRSRITGLNKKYPDKNENENGSWKCGVEIEFSRIIPIKESIRNG